MKREYTKPEVEITRFTTEDIITTSSSSPLMMTILQLSTAAFSIKSVDR